MPEKNDFVRRAAEAYDHLGWGYGYNRNDLDAWDTYAEEVGQRWRDRSEKPSLVFLRRDITEKEFRENWSITGDLFVWRGGVFSPGHPLTKAINTGDILCRYLPAYLLSRAVHDLEVHIDAGLSFSFRDELKGALLSAEKFSPAAKRASWTDDVAMSCYREFYGEWPQTQRPIICEPDWDGLRRYLEETENATK